MYTWGSAPFKLDRLCQRIDPSGSPPPQFLLPTPHSPSRCPPHFTRPAWISCARIPTKTPLFIHFLESFSSFSTPQMLPPSVPMHWHSTHWDAKLMPGKCRTFAYGTLAKKR